jgi:hypothetical protein
MATLLLKKRIRLFILILLNIALLMTSSCRVPPSGDVASGMITEYFEALGYEVIDLDLGAIKESPLAEKTYMGRRSYDVEVKTITLEPTKNIGPPLNYQKGQRLTFKNATVKLVERESGKDTWDVSIVNGIIVS